MAEERSGELSLERRDVLSLVLRLILGLALVTSCVALLGYFLKPTGEAIARGFVSAFGLGGMALGTFLADGVHFPVPPQFYMLLAIASGTPPLPAFSAIALASVSAGFFGYLLAGQASRLAWLARKTEHARQLLLRAFERYGYRAALVASLLPIPYSVLCYLAGLNRLPRSFVVLLTALRVPKLVAFYYLVHLGWSIS